MTNKEAIEYANEINFCCGCNEPQFTEDAADICDRCEHRQFFELAVETLEKADRYRWHDLRKDPEDLPKDVKPVLIVDWVVCDESHIGYELGIYSQLGWMRQTNHKVIAWREIEDFGEVEE